MTLIIKNSSWQIVVWRFIASVCVVWSVLSPAPLLAAGPNIKPFDVTTWSELVQRGPRPAAYVFTTTYCSTCPDALDKLQSYVKKTGRKVELAAVVMDVSAEQAMPHTRHFPGATKFYVFNGFEPAIRQSVDPKWPNITPYIVMLRRDGSLLKTIGPPDLAMMKRWLE
jgi:thiol-disulfide isomerase/thioredoxin